MGGESRNHHWVPQCYLKGFAKSPSKKAQLHVIDTSLQQSFIANPRNVASARDFNRISADGFTPTQIEEDYANFEGKLARALHRIWQNRQLGADEDLGLLLNLVALLSVRNPLMRENVRGFHERIIKNMMHLTVATERRYDATFGDAIKDSDIVQDSKVDYMAMKEFVDNEKYSITMSTTSHVERELQLANSVLLQLAQRRWLLMRAAPDSGGFVTCDHPVCLIWSEKRDRGFFSSPGFGVKGTEVVFSVSHDLEPVRFFV